MRLVTAGGMALAQGLDEAGDIQLLAHEVIHLPLKNASLDAGVAGQPS